MAEAQKELATIEGVLAQKQQQLNEVEKQIRRLQEQYDEAVNNLADLEANIALSEARLNRSGRLTTALSDEQVRWEGMIKGFDAEIANLTGDILVAAGSLAYLGAFAYSYRQELLDVWLAGCKDQGINTTENFSLINVLADPYEIRLWNMYGLPRDRVSTENAILVTQASRWPLMIDPQEQVEHLLKNFSKFSRKYSHIYFDLFSCLKFRNAKQTVGPW